MSLIKKGDVVEYGTSYSWEMRVGIVNLVSQAGRYLIVIEFGTGVAQIVEFDDASIVHGYLHIDRPMRRGF